MFETAWQPQPGSQTLFLSCPIRECLYEGTRGPGKTDALLMDFAQHCEKGYGADWRGVLFREEYKQLDDIVNKALKWFRLIFAGRAVWLASNNAFKWKWRTGEELLLRAFSKPDDYYNFHGHAYPWIGWEELTNWANLDGYEAMKSCNRSSNPDIPRKIRATANPYGVGHNAVKNYFIDPAPAGQVIANEVGQQRVRISGFLQENKKLIEADPEYIKNLQSIKDRNKRRAWLFGRWDITSGGMFDDLWDPTVHIIEPFEIPSSWNVRRSFDWGSAKPFSVGWHATSDGTDAIMWDGRSRAFPRGTKFRVAEIYGWNGAVNKGSRMTVEQICELIKEKEANDIWLSGLTVNPGPADSSIWNEEDGHSLIQSFEDHHVYWEKANKRPGSRKIGWELGRQYLVNSTDHTLEKPGFYVFSCCRDGFIRTVPCLPRDKNKQDDVDTNAEDHAADEWRYELLHNEHGTFSGSLN